jgi:ankyrin repeat protein
VGIFWTKVLTPNAKDDTRRRRPKRRLQASYVKTGGERNIDTGSQQIARLLLDYRADVNARDADGDRALFVAAIGGLTAQVEFLLSRGADPNIQGEQGHFPLRLLWTRATRRWLSRYWLMVLIAILKIMKARRLWMGLLKQI